MATTSGLSSPGIGSGLDVNSIVTQLVALERRPIQGLQTTAQKLQTQLKVSALMLEISPLPLSMLDTQGRYLSVNQAWEEFTGRRRAERDAVAKELEDLARARSDAVLAPNRA